MAATFKGRAASALKALSTLGVSNAKIAHQIGATPAFVHGVRTTRKVPAHFLPLLEKIVREARAALVQKAKAERLISLIRALTIRPTKIARRVGCSKGFIYQILGRKTKCPASIFPIFEALIFERRLELADLIFDTNIVPRLPLNPTRRRELCEALAISPIRPKRTKKDITP